MEKNVIISVIGSQTTGHGDSSALELVTEGKYYKEGNTYYIKYNESEVTGLEGTTTTIKVDNDVVTLMREGSVNSQFVFQKGKKHISYYDTAHGAFVVGIFANNVDIKMDDRSMDKYGITELYHKITIVNADSKYEIYDGKQNLRISTLKSTDKGVAFLIDYNNKKIYHAGDLNLWVWKEENKQYNNNMKARFEKELSKIKGLNIDVAFAPLDPRQEEWFGLGLDALLDNVNVKYVFPMHFWDKPEVIQMYKKEREIKPASAVIVDVEKQGQSWIISI